LLQVEAKLHDPFRPLSSLVAPFPPNPPSLLFTSFNPEPPFLIAEPEPIATSYYLLQLLQVEAKLHDLFRGADADGSGKIDFSLARSLLQSADLGLTRVQASREG
jgi:hypothetical protein